MVKTSLEKWPKTDLPSRKIADENERAATTRKRSRHRGGDCDGYRASLLHLSFAAPLAQSVPTVLLSAHHLCGRLFRLARRRRGFSLLGDLLHPTYPNGLAAPHAGLRDETVRGDHRLRPGWHRDGCAVGPGAGTAQASGS